ncbi:DUF4232 domain-containing protein [Catenulispora yoronensis]|uniref:DUF4232 domain-containing protein n=1 Tax=Catenulispora yoronensis TaxID=450799 RepID=A0ABN2UC98_9ACTN
MTDQMTDRLGTPRKHLLAVAAIAASGLLGLTACGSAGKADAANAGSGSAATSTPAVGAPSTNPPGADATSGSGAESATANPSQNPSQNPTQSQNQSPNPNQNPNQTQTHSAPTAPKTTTAKPSTPKTTAPARPTDCATTQLKPTVTNLTRPVNHVLLTVTNTGTGPCNLYYYPGLRFDADQQSVTQAVEDSKPQAVVTIAPGESAYAAIGTSAADGSGGAGRVEKQVEVFLESRDQSGSLPGELTLPLPANTYVDDKAFVTYWQSDLQSAVAW